MRTTRESADGLLATDANQEAVCCNSIRILSAAAFLTLAACSGPKEPSIEVSQATLSQYENTCGLCHEDGVGGAPITGDAEDWNARVAKGMNKVRENAIIGYEGATGIMPAKGGYENLTDDEVNAIVDYMIDISR